jgi:hypothetical protein
MFFLPFGHFVTKICPNSTLFLVTS